MTRPFAARDLLWLRRQGDAIACFDLESEVLDGRSPLGLAVSGLLDPLKGGKVGASSVASFVLPPESRRLAAFVQLRLRRPVREGVFESDVFAITPAIEQVPGAALTWQRLIGDGCQFLAKSGVLRVYAAVDEGDGLTLQVLRQCAFQPYANDTVFRLDGSAVQPMEAKDGTAPRPTYVTEDSVHRFAIHGMIRNSRPNSLEAHEPDGGDWERAAMGGRFATAQIGRVMLDHHGEVAGAWRIIQGRRGVWLRIACRDTTYPGELLDAALAHIDGDLGGPRPVFCTALGHESGVNLVLRSAGFLPHASRFRLVRHLAARRVAPAWAELPHAVAASPSPPITQFGGPAESAVDSESVYVA